MKEKSKKSTENLNIQMERKNGGKLIQNTEKTYFYFLTENLFDFSKQRE